MRSEPKADTRPSEPRRPRPGRRRPHRSPPAAAEPCAAAHTALQRVLDRGDWTQDALSPDEADRLAGLLRAWLESGGSAVEEIEGIADVGGPQRTLLCRLIDLVRAELLGGDCRVADADLLGLLRSLERARQRFEPAWHQALSSKLTGAHALDLVIELAHDLRSPLTSIMFLSETLRKGQSGEINEVQRKQLGIVYSAALGLTSVASDVIDLAREQDIGGHGMDLPAPFSLSELLESVRVMVAPMAEEKKLDLRFMTPEHDVRVGQAVPLSRVLLNLTTNALKFTEQGMVEIVAREIRGPRVEFSIRDTGRGMDADALAAMYEPFRRSRSSTGFHFSGTGLGLAISRRLVELMGGTLKVESRVDEGTRFFFEIDLPRGSRI